MNGQEKEKILHGLNSCSEYINGIPNICDVTECPYRVVAPWCTQQLAHDAGKLIRELLKPQEPRVLTLEEVKQHNNQDGCIWFEQPTYNAVPAFVRKEDFEIEVISPYTLGESINHRYWTDGNYGKTWRCWSSKPTDKQKEVVKWK